MLAELRITNFAIIDSLTLEFGPGLTILTGETGAGKSIIIDAVESLLGVRADSTVIRQGEDRASVEGTFKIPENLQVEIHALLEPDELMDDPEYVVLTREMRREGRNIVRVNGRTVSLSLLKKLGELLIDLHGQSEHLSLLRVSSHLGLLDRFAEDDGPRHQYEKKYRQWQKVQKEISAIKETLRDAARQQELLKFQIDEIQAAQLNDGEEETLTQERNRLANAETLAESANKALVVLSGEDDQLVSESAVDLVGSALQAVQTLNKLDPTNQKFEEQTAGIFENLTDLANEIRSYLETIEFDPKRLEQVEQRLGLIQSLNRKYGGSIAAVKAFLTKSTAEMEGIETADERLETLLRDEVSLKEELSGFAQALTAQRSQSAEILGSGIESELNDLKMAGARFAVDLRTQPDENGLLLEDGTRAAFDLNGVQQAEFMVAPNPGEGLKPLVKTASGGETARLMLALKNVLAKADQTPTLIFDEIDQGIGGRVGAVVGQKLWELSCKHQVFCITHLPQLAGYGDQHYRVEKQVVEGRTSTVVKSLTADEKIMELAQMLGDVSDGTLQSAHEILQTVHQHTRI